MKAERWLAEATGKLEAAGVPSANLDALILLEDCSGQDRGWLLAHPEVELGKAQVDKLNRQIKRRAVHEPLAYIRGFTEFYGRRFKLNKHVLEPRPESETMIELLKNLYKAGQLQRLDGVQDGGEQRTELYSKYREGVAQPLTQQSAKSASGAAGSASRRPGTALTIADVGTGCGAIGITAKLEIPKLEVDLYDIDSGALAVARHNCHLHELSLHAYKRDLLNRPARSYDIILANLPYVPAGWHTDRAAAHEPRHAIVGGGDGLDFYRRLFNQLAKIQAKPAYVLTESLPPQHKDLAQIAKAAGYRLKKSQDFIQLFYCPK